MGYYMKKNDLYACIYIKMKGSAIVYDLQTWETLAQMKEDIYNEIPVK